MTDFANIPLADRREMIAFRIGDQEFAVDIMSVREIRGWTVATPLPRTPAYVHGVINLRGAVLPIIDLASRLGLGVTEPDPRHVIIVCRVGDQTMGLLVDAVSDILTVTDSLIQPTPEVGCDQVRDFVRGIIAMDGRMISLIGLDRLLPAADLEAA